MSTTTTDQFQGCTNYYFTNHNPSHPSPLLPPPSSFIGTFFMLDQLQVSDQGYTKDYALTTDDEVSQSYTKRESY